MTCLFTCCNSVCGVFAMVSCVSYLCLFLCVLHSFGIAVFSSSFHMLRLCFCTLLLYVLFWLCVLHHIVSLRFGMFCVLGMRVCVNETTKPTAGCSQKRTNRLGTTKSPKHSPKTGCCVARTEISARNTKEHRNTTPTWCVKNLWSEDCKTSQNELSRRSIDKKSKCRYSS